MPPICFHSYDSYQVQYIWQNGLNWFPEYSKRFLQIFRENHQFENQVLTMVHMNHFFYLEQSKLQMEIFDSTNNMLFWAYFTYGLDVMFSTKILPRTQALSLLSPKLALSLTILFTVLLSFHLWFPQTACFQKTIKVIKGRSAPGSEFQFWTDSC